MSLGDERTLDDGRSGQDTVVDDIEVGDFETRYRVEGTLGQGGMGAVLLATDTRLDRKVAIKRILGEAAGNRLAVQRFLTEAKAIAALNHPNIVQIYDYGRAKDGPFLIMEYVDGGSLLDRCRESALPLEEAIDLACQLCDGLAKAHDLGIIHRDIKPPNVLLTKSGTPKLTDFGLAKAQASDHGHTMTGAVLGTPDFMPPEQRHDASLVDHRSDLWSLAATVYQMVTGRSPKVIHLHELPQALQAVIAKSLADHKDARYQSAVEFRDALRQATEARAVGLVSQTAVNVDDSIEGQCSGCGTINTDLNRKFCRKCGGPLRYPCLKCDAPTAVWETICGECGANQPQLLADLRATADSKRRTAESLSAAGSLEEAIAVAQEVAGATHPLLAENAAWAAGFVRDTTEEIERQRVFAVRQLAFARRHAEASDDAAAIALLEAIPEPMRGGEVQTLLETCRARLREVTGLIEEVETRVAADDLDGLVPMVARILQLRGNEDEWVSLHRELLARRDGRLRDAKDALVADDIARACAAVAGSRVEDFDKDDCTLVQHVLACAGIATPLTAAIRAERCDEFVAAATALQAIPEASRGGVVPGRSETIAEFLARMLRNVHRETQRQERRARHAAQRKKIAELRAAREVRGREIIEACTTAGIAAEQTRCEVETTVGPIVVVIRRSLRPSCTLWFATAVRARAFDAAAVQASEDGGGGESFRIVSDVAPPGVNEIVNSMAKGTLGAERQHDLLVAIDWPAGAQAPPAVVFNAGPGLWRSTIGWIDQDASANALAAFRRFGNLRCDAPGSLLGVVKTVRLAAPPLCWDLTPQLQLGADLAEQSRWEESVAAFEAAVAHDPHDAKAWMGIAHGLKQLGRFREGVEAMERAFAANPKVAVFLYNSACYHAMAGHTGLAIEVLAKAIAMQPKWRETAKIDSDFTAIRRDKAFLAVIRDREPARWMEADLKQGVALADRGRCEEAVATLRSLTERHAHLTEAWVAIGRCLKRLGLPSDAATAMRRGLEASRGHPRLWYNLACYASLAGQATEALQALMTAISLYPEYAEAAAKDRDLDPVRSDPRFAVILAAAESA